MYNNAGSNTENMARTSTPHVAIRLPIRSSAVVVTTNIRMDNVLTPISPISSCPPAWGPGQSPLSTSDCSWLPRLRNDISLLLVIFDCNLSPFLPATSSHDDALTLKPAPCARTWHLCMIAPFDISLSSVSAIPPRNRSFSRFFWRPHKQCMGVHCAGLAGRAPARGLAKNTASKTSAACYLQA